MGCIVRMICPDKEDDKMHETNTSEFQSNKKGQKKSKERSNYPWFIEYDY